MLTPKYIQRVNYITKFNITALAPSLFCITNFYFLIFMLCLFWSVQLMRRLTYLYILPCLTVYLDAPWLTKAFEVCWPQAHKNSSKI